MFFVNNHRRYHVGFQEAVERIRDVQDTTGCPVTSIYIAHGNNAAGLPRI